MIDPISALRSASVTGLDRVPMSEQSPGRVDPAAQERFEAHLKGDAIRVADASDGTVRVDFASNPWVKLPGPAEAMPTHPSLAARISDELDSVRNQWQQSLDLFSELQSHEGQQPDMGQMLRLMQGMQVASVNLTMLTQLVTVATGSVSQLMKAS
jgi:hypothetical protein